MVNDLQLKEFIYEQPAVPAKYLIQTKITTLTFLTLRAHRTNVGCTGSGRHRLHTLDGLRLHCRRRGYADHVQSSACRRTRRQVILRTGAKFLPAMGAAEVIGLSGVIERVLGSGGLHLHSTDWIFHRGCRLRGIIHSRRRRLTKLRRTILDSFAYIIDCCIFKEQAGLQIKLIQGIFFAYFANPWRTLR